MSTWLHFTCIAAYEMHIEDLLRAIVARKQELNNTENLDDFPKDRQSEYWEVMDII